MHAALFALLLAGDAELTRSTQERDIQGLIARSAPTVVEAVARFRFITQPGPFGTGSQGGWQVETTAFRGKTYAVFTTRMTSQDIGEMVFRMENGKLVEYLPEADTLGVVPIHHVFDVRFDPSKRHVAIVDRVQFRADKAGEVFSLRMSPQYRISKVTDAAGNDVDFAQAGGTIFLPVADAPRFDYTLRYDAVVNQPQFAGSIGEQEALLTNDYWYPMSGRHPATYTAKITAPSKWISFAQGELTHRADDGKESIFHYRMDLPTVYFSLSSAPYRVFTKVIGERAYSVASTKLTEEQMDLQCELNAPVIEFFDKIFPYPFTTWTSVESAAYGGGALEAYSFATYGTGWLPDEDAHEPAHTWFGGVIPNSYLRSFWNESFASYCEGFFDRECPIGSREDRRRAYVQVSGASEGYNAGTCASSGVFAGSAATTMGYGKGAEVLQVLESEIGPEGMKRAMRQWFIDHKQGTLGEWEDFERAVERSQGKSFKWFFDQWIRRPGYPRFTFRDWKWEKGMLTGKCVFTGPAYRLPFEALLTTRKGSTTVKGSMQSTANPNVYAVAFPSNERPVSITIDPWQKLLRQVGNGEKRTTLAQTFRQGRKLYADSTGKDWIAGLAPGRKAEAKLPPDPAGWSILAHPKTTPRIASWLAKAGATVTGSTVTFRGATVDLRKGGFITVVELGAGKSCVLALGKTKRRPHVGQAKAMLFDEFGRCMRAMTDPVRSGPLTFRLQK